MERRKREVFESIDVEHVAIYPDVDDMLACYLQDYRGLCTIRPRLIPTKFYQTAY